MVSIFGNRKLISKIIGNAPLYPKGKFDEYIIGAAVKQPNSNDIYIGDSHYDAFKEAGVTSVSDWDNWEEGFVTNKGKFVSREQAFSLAKKNKQIDKDTISHINKMRDKDQDPYLNSEWIGYYPGAKINPDEIGKFDENVPRTVASRFLTAQRKKIASSYIQDICFKDLPEEIKKDVFRFCNCKPITKFIQYGMVVSELLGMVDPHNFKLAEDHINSEEMSEDEVDETYARIPTKYILIVNGKICDGHHFLAAASRIGITNSLNVLDLSPARFQTQS